MVEVARSGRAGIGGSAWNWRHNRHLQRVNAVLLQPLPFRDATVLAIFEKNIPQRKSDLTRGHQY